MDSLPRDRAVKGADDGSGGEDGTEAGAEPSAARLRPSILLAKTPVYEAAVRYAFEHSASLKFFSWSEDLGNFRDRDVLVHVGPESRRIGGILRDMVDVDVMSGLELRNMMKKQQS